MSRNQARSVVGSSTSIDNDTLTPTPKLAIGGPPFPRLTVHPIPTSSTSWATTLPQFLTSADQSPSPSEPNRKPVRFVVTRARTSDRGRVTTACVRSQMTPVAASIDAIAPMADQSMRGSYGALDFGGVA